MERWLVEQGPEGASRSTDGWYTLDQSYDTEEEALSAIHLLLLQDKDEEPVSYATRRQVDGVDDRYPSTIIED